MKEAIIRVGLVGFGLAGSVFHAPLIRACKRMELTAILTSREAPNAVDSLDKLIERSDLVVVASPNTSHYSIAWQALEQDRHVVVDKPFTATLDQADELIRIASDRGRLLSAFHNRRWDADYLTIRNVLPKLGDILLFEANWDRFRPSIKQGWREIPEPGAGLLNDLGPHLVDQVLLLFGAPDAVEADVVIQRPHAAVDDYFAVTFAYGQRRVCLRSSTLIAAPRPRFAVHGTEGSYVKYGLDPQEAQLKLGLDPLDMQFGVDTRMGTIVTPDGRSEPVENSRGNYLAYYDRVAAAILDGSPVPVTAEDARTGLALIALARRASAEGRRLQVPGASSTAE